jgi:DNA-binding response OmpR family regulator
VSYRVLVIEDDRDIARIVDANLRSIGCDTTVAHDGTEGLARATKGSYDLIVLDLMLPGTGGFEICRRIRASSPYTRVLMLTAKSSEPDRVLGLELGADDYMTKPFSIPEFLARVKALLRRIEALQSSPRVGGKAILRIGELVIDVEKRKVARGGELILLTAKEFELLLEFARHPGKVYTRAELLDAVWGYAYEGYDHTVNSHINRLRAKIETDMTRPRYVLTMWGVGYKLAEEPRSVE